MSFADCSITGLRSRRGNFAVASKRFRGGTEATRSAAADCDGRTGSFSAGAAGVGCFSLPRRTCTAMSRTPFHSRGWLAVGLTLILAAGCAPTQPFYFFEKGDLSHYIGMATKIEAPDVKEPSLSEVNDPAAPLTLSNPKFDSIWDLSLEDTVHITLENSKVMRTLGGRFGSQGGSRPQVSDAPTSLQSNPQRVEKGF